VTPPWFRLLDRYRRDGHFGLTPSFLVGALRDQGDVSGGRASEEDLRHLLVSMRDETPAGFTVRIAECDKLRQAVAAVLPSVSLIRDAAGERVSATLYAWPQYFASESRTVESLLRGLWPTFGAPIQEGRFSLAAG
jgi:hypothetical protein